MEISDRLRQAILRCASREEIWKIAAEEGMETLRRCALRSALEGLTSLEESLKVSL
jgi:type II secretory ATPase GspE/PulE/Tfp pilus assembly ATPase PilB-like protein